MSFLMCVSLFGVVCVCVHVHVFSCWWWVVDKKKKQKTKKKTVGSYGVFIKRMGEREKKEKGNEKENGGL